MTFKIARTSTRLMVLTILMLATLSAAFQPSLPTAKAQTYSNNIILNHSFEEGLNPSGAYAGYPRYWLNWTKHGGSCSLDTSCISLDNEKFVTGGTSAKLDLGQLDIGFISLGQSLPSSLTFRNLTDRPDGLDMWFYYLPKYSGSGDIRIRILYGENIAEMGYVFDPDPSLGYPNSTADATVCNPTCIQLPAGTKNIFRYGYAPGEWHHVKFNIRADWAAPLKITNSSGTFFERGFSLDVPFPRIQVDALGLKSFGLYHSETVWIDDVKVCADSQTQSSTSCDQPPPPADHWIDFTATDLDGNDVTSKVKWKLFNNIDQEIPYTLGQLTLPDNWTYTLKIYYPTDTGQTLEPYLIYQSFVPLDTFQTINLPMKPQSPFSPYYIAFNNPIDSITINQYDPTLLNFTASGTSTPPYTIIVDVARPPALVVKKYLPTNFSYDPAHSVVAIRTDYLGEFTVFFNPPLQIPGINFEDLAQQPVQIGTVDLKVVSSGGNQIAYQPGRILANDTYRLNVNYKGRQIYNNPLDLTSPDTITLSMLPLQTVPGGYAAFNTTATSTNKSETSTRITITIIGTAPLLLIVDLPTKPLSVEQNGQKIVSWSYDETSKTLELSSPTDGTFTILLPEPAGLPVYLITGVALAGVLAVLGLGLLKRRRRNNLSGSGQTTQ